MPTLNTFAPNTIAESGKVNTNFQNISNVLRPTYEVSITGGLVVGTDLVPLLIVPQAMTIERVSVRLKNAPSGSAIILDINKNGSTIWSNQDNRIQIADGALTGLQTVFNTTSLAVDDYLTIDVDQIGSTFGGSDLTIAIRCSL